MKLIAFLLALIPLVVIHELGHFLMAKLGGIHVTKFCIGFGKKLFSFNYRGTEYCWNLLPFGGYVDFMGEVVYTGRIPDDASHFYNRPKWLRFLVLVMGPAFNIILAFGLYWVYHTVEPYEVPVYHGEPYTVGYIAKDSPEALAGLQVGDRILSLDDEAITDWDQIANTLVLSPNKEIELLISRQGEEQRLRYTVSSHEKEGFGLQQFLPATRNQVKGLIKDYPAHLAGFQHGDVIYKVNGREAIFGDGVLQAEIAGLAPEASTLEIMRQGQLHTYTIAPKESENGWILGIDLELEYQKTDLNVTEAFGVAWLSLKRDSTLLFKAVKKLVMGALPLKMLSGPVGVAMVAEEALQRGAMYFILTLALLSLNLGIMNLLPIPVLDGGEIFVLLVEGIARRDFSLMTKMRLKMVGLFFLIGLMGFVVVSDILKVVT